MNTTPETKGVVCFNTWAGRVEIHIQVLGESKSGKRFRVQCLEPVTFKGWGTGDIVYVPKYAVRIG